MQNIFDVLDKKYFDNYLEDAKEYGYQSLVLGVIDSVFSISAKYESTQKVVERFSQHANFDMYKDEYKTSDFIKEYGNISGDYLASDIFKNRQRTSSTNGILKADVVIKYINTLYQFGIETKEDLLNFKDKEMIKKEIGKIKGQKSGITFEYLLMLAGDNERFKPDRHIYKFFENYLCYGKMTEESLKNTFIEQYNVVIKQYPRFTIRMFDNLIWKFVKTSEDNFNKSKSMSLEQPYFMREKAWYYFDKKSYKFYLTDKAPQKAKDSYNLFYSHFNTK